MARGGGGGGGSRAAYVLDWPSSSGPGVASARSFLASEWGDATQDGGASQDSLFPTPGLRSGRQSMLHSATGGSVAGGGGGALRSTSACDGTQHAMPGDSRLTPISVAMLDLDKPPVLPVEQPEQHGRSKHTRSHAAQCAPVALTSRGVQVLPWELRVSVAAEDTAAHGAEAAAGGPVGQAGGAAEAAAAAAACEGVEEDEEALAALAAQQSVADLRGGGLESHRSSPLGSHRGMQSLSPSRRGSVAGAGTGIGLPAVPDAFLHTELPARRHVC